MRALLDKNILIHCEAPPPVHQNIGLFFSWLDHLVYDKLCTPLASVRSTATTTGIFYQAKDKGEAATQIRKLIIGKVLEFFKNGIAVGMKKARKVK